MKKTLFILFLCLFSGLNAQPVLGVYGGTFKDAYLFNDPLEATVLVKNTGNQSFSGNIDIYVNAAPASTPSFLLQIGIISLNNVILAPYEEISVDLSVFTASPAYFSGEDDIVIIWPKVIQNDSGTSVIIGDTLIKDILVTPHATSQLNSSYKINKIKVYPTLAKDNLRIKNYGFIRHLSLYTFEGKHIKDFVPQFRISIEDLANGSYYLLISDTDGQKKIVPFIIKR